MRRIILFLLALSLFVLALNIIALPIPYSAAQALPAADSPLPTPSLELTPPHRPTPTQGPPPQPDSEPPGGAVRDDPRPTPAARGIVTEMEPMAIAPTPVAVMRAATQVRIRARVSVAAIERRRWTLWEKHNLD